MSEWQLADERTTDRYRNPWTVLLRVLAATIWFLLLMVGLAYAALVDLSGDSNCPISPNSSTYGTFRWSVVPPGPTCTFTQAVHGIDEVRGPTPVMSIWLGVLVLGLVLFYVFPRPWRRSSGR